jgi:hypothetical protein
LIFPFQDDNQQNTIQITNQQETLFMHILINIAPLYTKDKLFILPAINLNQSKLERHCGATDFGVKE